MSSNEKCIDWDEDDLASDIGAAAGYHHGLILGPDVHPKMKANGIKAGAQLIKIGDKHVHYWEYHVIRGYLDDYLWSEKESRLVFRNKVTWNNSSWKDTFLSIAQTLGCCGGSAMKSNDRFIKHRNHNAAIRNLEVKIMKLEQEVFDVRKVNINLMENVIKFGDLMQGLVNKPFINEEEKKNEGGGTPSHNENARDDNV